MHNQVYIVFNNGLQEFDCFAVLVAKKLHKESLSMQDYLCMSNLSLHNELMKNHSSSSMSSFIIFNISSEKTGYVW